MERKKLFSALMFSSLLFASCGNNSNESLSTSSEQSSKPDETVTTTATTSVSSTTSKPTGSDEPYAFDGIVRIHYRNHNESYSSKCLWVWLSGVNGQIYEFANNNNPDSYGLWVDFDLQAAPFNEFSLTELSYIVREKSTWDGQTSDTLIEFSKFKPYETTREDGRKQIDVYSFDSGNKKLTLYPTLTEAMGDYIKVAKVNDDWKSIYVEGDGYDTGNGDNSNIGIINAITVYSFPNSYQLLSDTIKEQKKNDYIIYQDAPRKKELNITLKEELVPTNQYLVEVYFVSDMDNVKRANVSFSSLFESEIWKNKYEYEGDDLGLTFKDTSKPNRATFKLWSPLAFDVKLYTYQKSAPLAYFDHYVGGTAFKNVYQMKYTSKGVYEAVVDLKEEDKFYTYYVSNIEGQFETIDPYAKASGINGIRGAILNNNQWKETDPEGFSSIRGNTSSYPFTHINTLNDLDIYEVHIRDFTASNSWVSNNDNRRGTYNAFVEEGTTYEGVSTGFDSLKELGVSAVQLLPVFDQDNDERVWLNKDGTYKKYPTYNWGYNPSNYNVIEGAYASNPEDELNRIKEFKNLVKKCADNDIRVIMDVVYNHVSSVSKSSFTKTMPQYYFKVDENGTYIDQTGCNNTLDSSKGMVERYIINSVCFYAKEYGIKGFRFDLMGCLETSTMRKLKDALYEIDPEIVVYGEGWRGSGFASSTQAGKENVYQYLGDNGKGEVGAFNDGGRNGLKGDTKWADIVPSYGFMGQGPSDLSENTMYDAACTYLGENRHVTQAGIATSPTQTINYVDCHDNYTLYDSLNYMYDGGKNCNNDTNPIQDAALATMSYVIFSQGAAFIHGGSEFFRQKIMKKDDPNIDLLKDSIKAHETYIEGDGFEIPGGDGDYLVRNSYQYGDSVNAFDWSRKVKYLSYFDKIKEAISTRKALVKEGRLGVSNNAIQGSYKDNDGNTKKYSRLWDDLVQRDASNLLRPVLAAQTEFSKMPASTKLDVYSFLGGRMNEDESIIGIGNGKLRVLYGSKRNKGDIIEISDYKLAISKHEMLFVERIA